MQDRRGYQIIPPAPAHPNAVASSLLPSGVLGIGYMYLTTHARLVGAQTYRRHQESDAITDDGAGEFAQSTWVDIARFKRYLGVHFTGVLSQVDLRVVGTTGTRVLARVKVTDGTTTVTGDAVDAVVDPSASLNLALGRINWAHALSVRLHPQATLAGLTLGQVCTVTVQAYALGGLSGSQAQRLHPELVTAWAEVLG